MILELALCLALVASPEDSLAVADELTAPLRQALREREYSSASRIAQRQLAMRRQWGQAPSLKQATSLTYLSLATRNLGDYATAEESAREALSMMIELYGREDGNAATAMNNLAGVLRARGDLVGAEALYRESLSLRTQQLGEDHAQLAGSYNNLGSLLRQLGDGAGAEEHLRRALEIAESNYGEEHSNVALAHLNLASTLRIQQRYDEAHAELRDASAIYTALADSVRQLQVRREVVITWLDSGRGEEGVEIARELVVGFATKSPLDVARAHVLLGRTLLAAKRWNEAIAELDLGREFIRDALGDAHPEVVRAGVPLGEALLRAGDPRALPVLEDCADSFESARARLALNRNRATVELPSPYELLARARLHAGDSEGAWLAAEAQNGRVLRELREVELDNEMAQRRSNILGELSRAEESLAQIGEASPDLRAELRLSLLEAESAWSQLQTEINVAHRGARPALRLAAVLAALDDETALIGWIDEAAYVLRHDNGLQWISIRRSPDSSKIQLLRKLLLAPVNAPAFAAPNIDPRISELVDEIHSALFADLPLNDIARLIIIAPRQLQGIPIELLVDEHFEVRYALSANNIMTVTRPAGQRRALFVGDPHFAGELMTRYSSLPKLRYSLEEVESSAEIVGNATVLLGEEASEQNLRAFAQADELQQFHVLHFATHALADASHPGQSRLVLSQSALGDPVETVLAGEAVFDGTISANEIARSWRLDADLITLSACETALGRPTDGEGYLGLAHAFFEAGGRRLLVSLWPVDDEATSLLMKRFYELWIQEERSPAAALREAKRWLREWDGGRFAHPYSWSAFVLVEA